MPPFFHFLSSLFMVSFLIFKGRRNASGGFLVLALLLIFFFPPNVSVDVLVGFVPRISWL